MGMSRYIWLSLLSYIDYKLLFSISCFFEKMKTCRYLEIFSVSLCLRSQRYYLKDRRFLFF